MRLVWFRRDLRTIDNTAFIAAINSNEPVVAAFIATPDSWSQHHMAPMQADLIKRRLFELQNDLASLGVPLIYAETSDYASSVDVVCNWVKQYSVTSVHLNKEYEINEVRRDDKAEQALTRLDVVLHRHDDKCQFIPGSVVNKQGHYFKVFTPYKRAYLQKLEQFPVQVQKVTAVNGQKAKVDECDLFSKDCSFRYPTEESQAYQVSTEQILDQLRSFVKEHSDDYQDERDFPAIEGTSRLSPYLAIGALSVRQCMARLLYQQTAPLSEGRQTWLSELIWREFYQHLLYFEPKLSRGESFLPWGVHLRWENCPRRIKAWQQGQTGYPIVDAAMRQLNQTGWMHNRLRMIVASFLVKDLQVDWRVGEDYFMSKLVDGEYAANNGGWQWCASTGCDGQPYFRIFNPTTQGERFDPKGEFVRRWVPELADLPDKQIHQPSKWLSVKGSSYPAPIVDHKVQREITLANYKNAKDFLDAT
ncbi:deoxyribodipyrimidine photolyase [Vibrio sinaloensis DSM 21326]|uniref:Deoxyribodipyrimidine photo-lyase n=1 Tax=Vibrio sinaloensis DSM 21326 TaxID=945550 RepID=E8M373_PHOS4|nr:deoxyribodipyrimidine photo-lyase [Vibrio sinaloensis]EGA71731.1 deoxyribodipyrimidine photolyase [Vibrio sinaloensis DSM 21326]